MDIIKVSGNSRTSAVAGAIAGVFRENQHAEVQAIGAGAVNQAVKALVLATGYLAEDGYEVIFIPEFVDVEIDGKTRTAVRLVVEPRIPGQTPGHPTEKLGTFPTDEPAEAFPPTVSDTPGQFYEGDPASEPAPYVPETSEQNS